jgi:hypothetical protein
MASIRECQSICELQSEDIPQAAAKNLDALAASCYRLIQNAR